MSKIPIVGQAQDLPLESEPGELPGEPPGETAFERIYKKVMNSKKSKFDASAKSSKVVMAPQQEHSGETVNKMVDEVIIHQDGIQMAVSPSDDDFDTSGELSTDSKSEESGSSAEDSKDEVDLSDEDMTSDGSQSDPEQVSESESDQTPTTSVGINSHGSQSDR